MLGLWEESFSNRCASRSREPELEKLLGKWRRGDVHELVEALEAHRWQVGPTAAALGISRGALYRRIEIRKAADLEPAEIEAALARRGGQAAARQLKVSPQGLKRRLMALYGNWEDAGR